MNREGYEGPTDKTNEAGAKALLERRGYQVCEFGRFAPCDFLAFKDGKNFLVEFKARTHKFGTYSTVIMPEKKLRRVTDLAETLGVGFLFVNHFTDGYYATVVADYHTTMGGRTDRNDPNDIMRVAHIPTTDFKRI